MTYSPNYYSTIWAIPNRFPPCNINALSPRKTMHIRHSDKRVKIKRQIAAKINKSSDTRRRNERTRCQFHVGQTSQISIRKLILTHGRIRLELDAFWQGWRFAGHVFMAASRISARLRLASPGSGALPGIGAPRAQGKARLPGKWRKVWPRLSELQGVRNLRNTLAMN